MQQDTNAKGNTDTGGCKSDVREGKLASGKFPGTAEQAKQTIDCAIPQRSRKGDSIADDFKGKFSESC